MKTMNLATANGAAVRVAYRQFRHLAASPNMSIRAFEEREGAAPRDLVLPTSLDQRE